MPNTRQWLIFPMEGMNSRANASLLPETSYARATNVTLEKGMLTTRPGIRALHTKGGGTEQFSVSGVQGAIPYNPAKGQSAIAFGNDQSSLLVAAGGRKFHVTFEGNRGQVANVEDVTTIEASDPSLHLVWLFQAENYVLAQDGASDTWIWSGGEPPFASPGYRPDDPPESRLANGATVGGYSHGRIHQVLDSRRIIISNSLHGNNQTDASDLLKMEEDGYWAGGGWFAPPSAMGNIVASGLLPRRNTEAGQGELIFHCEDGVFSIDLNIFPRTAWTDTPMVNHMLLRTGARGPYALTLYDGDQFFRSRHGIQSLRSAAAESQLLGNPLRPISGPVEDFFFADHQQYVRFCSVEQWAHEARLLVTTGLDVKGPRRYGMGALVLNFAPNPMQTQRWCWESLWTLPEGMERIAQMVSGLFNERERFFFLCHDADDNTVIAEADDRLDHDILPDGTISPISCQVMTRFDRMDAFTEGKRFMRGTLHLANIRGEVVAGVWLRTHESEQWRFWGGGRVGKTDDCACLCGDRPGACALGLGEIPDFAAKGNKIQALIRWRGKASLEALNFQFERDGAEDQQIGARCLAPAPLGGDYSDFEYHEKTRWEDQIQ